MWRYYELLTDQSINQIQSLRKKLESGKIHPMEVKHNLAESIVGDFHSTEETLKAREHFIRVIQNKEPPGDIPRFNLDSSPKHNLVDLLIKASLAGSKSEGRRLIQQGGVSVDGQIIGDERAIINSDDFIIKVGKRRFARVSKA